MFQIFATFETIFKHNRHPNYDIHPPHPFSRHFEVICEVFGQLFSLDLQQAASSETHSEGTANITTFPVVGECLIGAPWALAPEPGQNCKPS